MSANEGAPVPQEEDGPGLLIHAAGPLEPDTLAGIPRSTANARAALKPGAAIEVVVQGPGVRLLASDSPASEAITHVRQLDVEILACANSLRSAGLEAEDLTTGIDTVPAAVAHLAERQWQGWAYVRP
ncbi:DsrE family protein [Pseudarthrobacter sp. P1]|uniref:DsrE family protein n=1 Tax=Pseudarthrobacter sp. P1 TaxID=3418418 RepID=UPI003CF08C55